jgi:hypothetical protein
MQQIADGGCSCVNIHIQYDTGSIAQTNITAFEIPYNSDWLSLMFHFCVPKPSVPKQNFVPPHS